MRQPDTTVERTAARAYYQKEVSATIVETTEEETVADNAPQKSRRCDRALMVQARTPMKFLPYIEQPMGLRPADQRPRCMSTVASISCALRLAKRPPVRMTELDCWQCALCASAAHAAMCRLWEGANRCGRAPSTGPAGRLDPLQFLQQLSTRPERARSRIGKTAVTDTHAEHLRADARDASACSQYQVGAHTLDAGRRATGSVRLRASSLFSIRQHHSLDPHLRCLHLL